MARPASWWQQLLAFWPLETSLVTWTFGSDATVLADYALMTTTTTQVWPGSHYIATLCLPLCSRWISDMLLISRVLNDKQMNWHKSKYIPVNQATKSIKEKRICYLLLVTFCANFRPHMIATSAHNCFTITLKITSIILHISAQYLM